jgi:Kef-type K+ transport system membrane component KefB
MIDLNQPVAFFLLIMSIILVTPLYSERVRLPGSIGIILGGMLIGPHGVPLIEADDRMMFLSTIGLVYLMFGAGLEVDINQFMRVRGRLIVLGFFTSYLSPSYRRLSLRPHPDPFHRDACCLFDHLHIILRVYRQFSK